jgi:hypothetical protein
MCRDIPPRICGGIGRYSFHRLLSKELNEVDSSSQFHRERGSKVVIIFVESLEGCDIEVIDSTTIDVVWGVCTTGIIGWLKSKERQSINGRPWNHGEIVFYGGGVEQRLKIKFTFRLGAGIDCIDEDN